MSKTRIRILVLFSSSEIGGAERSLSRMAMAESNPSVLYFLATLGSETGAWMEWVRSAGGNPTAFGPEGVNSSLVFYWHGFRNLIRHVQSTKPDILYAVGLKAALMARIIKIFRPRTKVVHAIRTNLPEGSSLARAFALSERCLGLLTDGYIANSHIARQRLGVIANIPESKVAVIYNGLEEAESPEPNSISRGNEICIVANISVYKGHVPFLEVVGLIKDVIPNVIITCVGRDDLGGLFQSEIEKRSLGANIVLTGYQKDPRPFLRRAAVFVLPSPSTEGTPTSILEAFSTATPVVAYAIGGIPELVSHEVDGLLIEPGNVRKMADALILLLQNPDLAARMGQAGRRKLLEDFTLAATVRKHRDCWHSLAMHAK